MWYHTTEKNTLSNVPLSFQRTIVTHKCQQSKYHHQLCPSDSQAFRICSRCGIWKVSKGKNKNCYLYLSFARRALSAWVVVGLEAETSKVLEGQGKSWSKFRKNCCNCNSVKFIYPVVESFTTLQLQRCNYNGKCLFCCETLKFFS